MTFSTCCLSHITGQQVTTVKTPLSSTPPFMSSIYTASYYFGDISYMLPMIFFIAKCVAVDDFRYRNCVSALPNHSTPIDPHEATPRTMRYDAMQYLTTRYFTSQFNAVSMSHSTFQYEAMQCNTIQYNTTCFNTLQCDTILCNAIPCKTVQYNIG